MSLQKCANDMAAHTEGWDLRECTKETFEAWLKDCIGVDFHLDSYISDKERSSGRNNNKIGGM